AAHCPEFVDGVQTYNGVGSSIGVSDFIHELYDASPHYDLGVTRITPPKSDEGWMFVSDIAGEPVYGYDTAGIRTPATYCISAQAGTPNCNFLSDGQYQECRLYSPAGRCGWLIAMKTTAGYIKCDGDSGGPIYFR